MTAPAQPGGAADDDETIRVRHRSEDDTVVSPRFPAPQAATSASGGGLGPTAVASSDDDVTIVRGATDRRSSPRPLAQQPGDRHAVIPDAAALRSPQAPRPAAPIRAVRAAPRPSPPSGAPVSGEQVDRGVRSRAVRRAVVAVVAGAALVCAVAAGMLILLT